MLLCTGVSGSTSTLNVLIRLRRNVNIVAGNGTCCGTIDCQRAFNNAATVKNNVTLPRTYGTNISTPNVSTLLLHHNIS